MKIISSLFLLWIATHGALAQDKNHPLEPFEKIVVSPKIKLVLIPGETESIRVTAANIEASQLNVYVQRGKLHIYLDDARYIVKRRRYQAQHFVHKETMYRDASITAYVTYRTLRSIEMRGEESLVAAQPLEARKLKLTTYGRVDVRLAALKVDKLKASLYGENKLRIDSGGTRHARFRLYGENEIDTDGLETQTAATTIYGEGVVAVNVQEEMRLNAVGEPMVYVNGPAHLSKGLVIGRVGIRTRR